MSCGHCTGRVKTTLEGLAGVTAAEVTLTPAPGQAVVTLSEDVADETLKKAVDEQGYKVIAIQ